MWSEGFGLADVENNVKCHVNSELRLASISKALTSLVVARLVERGKLRWNGTINDYLPESRFPAKLWKGKKVPITLRHLASHTSGLRASEARDYLTLHNYRNATEAISFFAKEPLSYEPGTKFVYSNQGWLTMQAIIESRLGSNGFSTLKIP